MGADGLKLAVALLRERLPDHLDDQLVIACHDELVVERPEEQAMAATMDEIVNPG
jgi:DNA polymerase I-like protein with 3'-5' exonuclease and polymerase domains